MRRPIVATTSLISAAAWCGPGAAAHCPPMARGLRVSLGLPSMPGVALTFDDGPHPEGTPAVLEALAHGGARATFFLVGEQVERYPELVAQLVAAGHEAAVHGYRHRNQMRLTPRRLAADTERAVASISQACGRAPAYYRPPYGAFTIVGLRAVRGAGLTPLLWSKWGRDWRPETSPAQIEALVTEGVRAGDVVLLHDADWYCARGAYRRTVAALPGILAQLRRRQLAALALRTSAASRSEPDRLSLPPAGRCR